MNSSLESLLEPLSGDQQERLADILTRYVDDMEEGRAPHPEDLLAAHPELDAPLREYLQSLNILNKATGGITSRRPKEFSPTDLPEGLLGDYRLVREIGRGGMGIVYEARQMSLGRTVALKVLPFAALLDQKQVARFQNEAQAAASLHHPNIVTVFAVGCERGVHYYSMRLIEGQSLCGIIRELRNDVVNQAIPRSKSIRQTEPYLSAGEPPSNHGDSVTKRQGISFSTVRSVRTRNYVRSAVELMAQAADALHHAHQCGVVHRDIKPSNLLVDVQGKLWVTDFGLARCAIGPDLTVTGDVLGTLRYMSPEQASGKTHLVDHRTDVYSLGITLFELLALRPAFDGDERTEVLRQVQQHEIPSLRAINSAVPYDLETIVLKATANSRDERYLSAQELAEDLRRFLAGEPAVARRPTWLDRSARWLVRHKRAAFVTLAGIVLALAGVSVTAILLAKKQAETDQALGRARSHLREIQRVVDRFGAGVSEQLRDVPGAERVRGNLLRETLSYYQAILTYTGDATVSEDAAMAAFKAGTVHELIGENQPALEMYRLAKQRFSQVVEARPGDPVPQADLALCDNNLGALLSRLGKMPEAEDCLRAAAQRQRTLVESYPDEPRFRSELSLTQINLGLALADIGRAEAAAKCYREAIALLQTGAAAGSSDTVQQLRLANAEHNLSGLLSDSDLSESERLAQESVSLLRHIQSPRGTADLALSLSNLGVLTHRRGERQQAISLTREAITLQEQLVHDTPLCLAHRVDLATSRNLLGQMLLEAGDFAEAEKELEAARQIFEQLAQDFPDDPTHCGGLAGVLNNVGVIQERQGKLDQAVESFERAVELQQSACERAPNVKRYRAELDRHHANLRRVQQSLGRANSSSRTGVPLLDVRRGKPWVVAGLHVKQCHTDQLHNI